MERQLFIHRGKKFAEVALRASLTGLILGAFGSAAEADKLTHSDGTTIEGTIKSEGADQLQITTKHGEFTFEKSDLVKIERTSQVSQATPVATPAIDNTKYIPSGPIDPFKPPQVPPLVRLIPTVAATGATSGTMAATPLTSPQAVSPTSASSTPSPTPPI